MNSRLFNFVTFLFLGAAPLNAALSEELSSIDSFHLNAVSDDELNAVTVETSGDLSSINDGEYADLSTTTSLKQFAAPDPVAGVSAFAPQGAADIKSSITLQPTGPIHIDEIPVYRGNPWK